ncbi:hypothetical protein BOO71_0004714 [Deinococcus marmoris]|uniref:Uncharacterized protein n=1 Tax=Deinococcus marmoris TaxID=249408 RepID=A0A1U7P0T3_9DEIO|nr:hypothetical protein BOO71_0004714 [Deinococcus marmoris]
MCWGGRNYRLVLWLWHSKAPEASSTVGGGGVGLAWDQTCSLLGPILGSLSRDF